MAAKRAGASSTMEPTFSPQWSQTLLGCHLLQKMENSRHDLLIVAVCWCHWPKPPEISMSCLFLDLFAKGIKTSGKIKRELKMLCKHQDNCEREMKVLGRRSKGIIDSGLAGTRIDWPKQCWQIGTYRKRKQIFRHHQSIHKPAPSDVNIATSTLSMKKVRWAEHVRKIGVEVLLTPTCLTELADEGIE